VEIGDAPTRIDHGQRRPNRVDGLDIGFDFRLFSAGNLSQLLYSLGFGALSLIVILYFQLIRGFDALTAGLLFLPLDLHQ
jgi:hypothetical protein